MRYRLRTLLVVMAGASFVFLGLRSPTALMSGLISVGALVTVLLALLMAMFSTGAARAMAIGYLIFCLGYLGHACVSGLIARWLGGGSISLWPLFNGLYAWIHFRGPARTFDPDAPGNFTTIGHHAVSCALGLAGAFIAQILYQKHRNVSAVQTS